MHYAVEVLLRGATELIPHVSRSLGRIVFDRNPEDSRSSMARIDPNAVLTYGGYLRFGYEYGRERRLLVPQNKLKASTLTNAPCRASCNGALSAVLDLHQSCAAGRVIRATFIAIHA